MIKTKIKCTKCFNKGITVKWYCDCKYWERKQKRIEAKCHNLKKPKKKENIKKVYKENVEIAKAIVKIESNYTCDKCGVIGWITTIKSNIHGSHIINEAKDHRLSTNLLNIKCLCYNCHLNWWHKNPVEAWEWFKKKRPWRREQLQELRLKYQWLGSIWKEWHLNENERLKKYYKELVGFDWK